MLAKDPLSSWTIFPFPAWAPSMGVTYQWGCRVEGAVCSLSLGLGFLVPGPGPPGPSVTHP